MSDTDKKKIFSSIEKDLFLKIYQNYQGILSCKKTNSVSALKKKQAWEKIQNEFNSSPIVSQKATTKQLTKLWYNMKAKAREAKTLENTRYLTGGGPSVDDMTTTDAKVIDLDKNILTNVQVDIDSDVNGSLMVLGNENDEAWGKNVTIEIPDFINVYEDASVSTQNFDSQPNALPDTKTNDTIIKKTPIKKISFGEKYLNKIDLLKIKILEEELNHKKEMHKEELKMKIMEREMKEKLWELEIKIKEKQLSEINK